MKGLLITHMGRRDEGLELVKKGIRLDLTSHICWHVHGLIQKGEKDYEGGAQVIYAGAEVRQGHFLLREPAYLLTVILN